MEANNDQKQHAWLNTRNIHTYITNALAIQNPLAFRLFQLPIVYHLGLRNIVCPYCHALHWKAENNSCCV